jgi:hypothetical protein
MTVPFAFANLSGNIALAKLDSNFNTPITIGNTSVLLGNTITTINNVTLANVTISSGTASNISLTSPLAVSSGGTGSANLTVNNVLIGNGTNAVTSVAPGTTGNVLTSIGGAWVSNVALTSVAAGSNTQVQYNNANLLAGSANFVFDGTNLGIGTSSPLNKLVVSNAGANGLEINPISGISSGVSFNGYNRSTSAYTPLTYAALSHYFQVGSSPATAATLDSSGNLGLGVTPSAWGSTYRSLEGSFAQTWYYSNVATLTGITSNTYNNGTNWIYKTGNAALRHELGAGADFRWYIAPPGTAGNAITFTQAMTLDASGNLGIGTSSPSASAILDAQSTTKGVRMPNMTTTQKNAISSPAAGLMVFDTTLAKLCVYSGSAWQTITSV